MLYECTYVCIYRLTLTPHLTLPSLTAKYMCVCTHTTLTPHPSHTTFTPHPSHTTFIPYVAHCPHTTLTPHLSHTSPLTHHPHSTSRTPLTPDTLLPTAHHTHAHHHPLTSSSSFNSTSRFSCSMKLTKSCGRLRAYWEGSCRGRGY